MYNRGLLFNKILQIGGNLIFQNQHKLIWISKNDFCRISGIYGNEYKCERVKTTIQPYWWRKRQRLKSDIDRYMVSQKYQKKRPEMRTFRWRNDVETEILSRGSQIRKTWRRRRRRCRHQIGLGQSPSRVSSSTVQQQQQRKSIITYALNCTVRPTCQSVIVISVENGKT